MFSHDNDMTLAEAEGEAMRDKIDQAIHELLCDTDSMTNYLSFSMYNGHKDGVDIVSSMQDGYAELLSILYQCDDIFADLFNGKTLEEIGKLRSLRPLRMLENIRESSKPLVQECINTMLAGRFISEG